MADVVKCAVLPHRRRKDFAAMNEVYAEFFGEAKPARTTVVVAALPLPGAKVEIDAGWTRCRPRFARRCATRAADTPTTRCFGKRWLRRARAASRVGAWRPRSIRRSAAWMAS
jgi:hypothetical protein